MLWVEKPWQKEEWLDWEKKHKAFTKVPVKIQEQELSHT